MNKDAAEKLALEALAWLAASDDLFGVFLGSTGANVSEVQSRAAEPDFLVSVLDFLVLDDQWIVGFCDHTGYAYDKPEHARQMLNGGGDLNWM